MTVERNKAAAFEALRRRYGGEPRALPVRKAMAGGPFIACHDQNGALLGAVAVGDLLSLQPNSARFDAQGDLNGALSPDGDEVTFTSPTEALGSTPPPTTPTSRGVNGTKAGGVLTVSPNPPQPQPVAKAQASQFGIISERAFARLISGALERRAGR